MFWMKTIWRVMTASRNERIGRMKWERKAYLLKDVIMIAVGYWGSIFQGIVVNCEGYPSETSYWRMRWPYYLSTNSFPTDRRMLSRYQYFLTLLGLRSILAFSSVQFSHSVVSNSLQPHELQHTRPPCPSPTLGVHPNPWPLSRWCYPTISSSVIPFSSCPQSFPTSESFQMSQLFAWGGQSIGVSSFSISLSNEHPGLISFRMDWLDLLGVQGTLKSLLQHHS